MGEDLAGAGLGCRHRVPGAVGPRRVPRQARLQPRRLRLHDLHRQLRAAAGGDREGRRGREPRRLLGAVGQPQLRGADQPRRAQQLPGVAAAVRRLRARRAHGPRPHERAARQGLRRRARLPARHLADARRRSRRRSPRRCARRCSRRATPTSSPATSAGRALDTPDGDRYTWPDSTYVREPPYFEGMEAEPSDDRADRGRPRPRRARRLGDDRPHLAGGRDQEAEPRRASGWSKTASSRRTSTRTDRGAATTR